MIKQRAFLAIPALAVSLISLTSGLYPVKAEPKPVQGQTQTQDQKQEPVQLMFVQTAEDIKADPKTNTLRLVNVNQQILYFSDRPVRVGGHITMPMYLETWTSMAGSDNFHNDPPNAVLSVYEPGSTDNKTVTVEINNPVVDGNDLVYNYKLIEGEIPKSGGQSALFIDALANGVGAGTRGAGLTGGYGGPAGI